MKNIEKKLNEILRLERTQIKMQKKLEKEGEHTEELEEKELNELEDIEKLEKEIRKRVTQKSLKKITYKDIGKAAIGAFVGIVSHFTILEGVHYAETLDATKATSFLIVSYIIGLIILYYTGFRKVYTKKILKILPLRLTIIYITTFAVIVTVLFIFNTVHGPLELYKQVAVASLPAIVGACAADLIGGE